MAHFSLLISLTCEEKKEALIHILKSFNFLSFIEYYSNRERLSY